MSSVPSMIRLTAAAAQMRGFPFSTEQQKIRSIECLAYLEEGFVRGQRVNRFTWLEHRGEGRRAWKAK